MRAHHVETAEEVVELRIEPTKDQIKHTLLGTVLIWMTEVLQVDKMTQEAFSEIQEYETQVIAPKLDVV